MMWKTKKNSRHVLPQLDLTVTGLGTWIALLKLSPISLAWSTRYRGELTDWTCSAPTAVDSCGGLECAEGYIGEVLFECRNAIQIPRTNTKHYQEQASKPNPDLSLFPAVGGQGFYVPTGCLYVPDLSIAVMTCKKFSPCCRDLPCPRANGNYK